MGGGRCTPGEGQGYELAPMARNLFLVLEGLLRIVDRYPQSDFPVVAEPSRPSTLTDGWPFPHPASHNRGVGVRFSGGDLHTSPFHWDGARRHRGTVQTHVRGVSPWRQWPQRYSCGALGLLSMNVTGPTGHLP